MTSDEWEAVGLLIENCWKGELDDTARASYGTFLMRYEAEEVMEALHLLVAQATTFVPSVGEIVGAMKKASDPTLPGWTEVWSLIERALRIKPDEDAASWLEEREGGDMIAAFCGTEGWQTLRHTPFYDPDYGALRIKDLQGRWDRFVEVAGQRRDRGLALAAARGGRGELGKPSFATGPPPRPKELEAGA